MAKTDESGACVKKYAWQHSRGEPTGSKNVPVEAMASTIDVARRMGDGTSNGYALTLLSAATAVALLATAASTIARSAVPSFSFSKIRSVGVSGRSSSGTAVDNDGLLSFSLRLVNCWSSPCSPVARKTAVFGLLFVDQVLGLTVRPDVLGLQFAVWNENPSADPKSIPAMKQLIASEVFIMTILSVLGATR